MHVYLHFLLSSTYLSTLDGCSLEALATTRARIPQHASSLLKQGLGFLA